MGAVNHLPCLIVARDGGAAQPLQNSDLDFLRTQRQQAVESRRKTLQRFARQAGDQIGVDVNAGLLAQEPHVIGQPRVVLRTADVFGSPLVESLNADFKLKGAGRELHDDFTQRLGQPVRNHLEVEEQAVVMAIQKKLQDGFARRDVQVEGAVNKFELAHAAVEEFLQFGQEGGQRELPHRHVEGGEAKFAGERTAAGRFDINDAVGDILLVVQFVRQREVGRVGQWRRDDFFGGGRTGQDLPAERGKFQVGFAGDDVIGQARDLLPVRFETDLGAAQDNNNIGADTLERRDDLGGLAGVPDINTQADDAGLPGQDRFHHIERALLDVKFDEARFLAQLAQIGQQITQAERGVNVFRV